MLSYYIKQRLVRNVQREIKMKTKETIPFKVIIVAFTAALAGLLFGLDVGVISGVLPFLGDALGENDVTKEIVVSALLAGAVLGTILSGFISKKYGRKNAILVSAVIFTIGSLLASAATTSAILIGGRFFLGIAVGIASFTTPLYLSEMAPKRIRGALISMYQLMITIGIVAAFLSDTLLSSGGHWRIMLGILAIPAALMFLGVSFLPKSPRWLIMNNKEGKALEVLSNLRSSQEIAETEYNEIKTSLKTETPGGFALLKSSSFRKVIILGIILQAAQQFTGINVVMYYAPEIFKTAGFTSGIDQMWGTVIVGITNVIATFIAIAFVDKVGRKPILYAGYSLMALCMFALGAVSRGGINGDLERFAAIGFLLFFIIGFAMSAGPIIWVLCSEIYPIKGREFGITVSTATNWICNTLIGATFLTMLHKWGPCNTYWTYGVANFAFLFILFYLVPETKGRSLEEIERNLKSGRKLREIGDPVSPS